MGRAACILSASTVLLFYLNAVSGAYVYICFSRKLLRIYANPTLTEKVLLREVQTITLYKDRYTNARRTSPVRQLVCTGGTAGCSAYIPPVVQCQNKGWDGFDVQWECKTDLDNSYRFGKIEVSCEGFDYPEDPYVLRGSCGLEYKLDLTEEGHRKSKSSYGGFGSGYSNYRSFDSSGMTGLIMIVIFLALAYAIYKIFLSDTYGTVYQSPPPPGFSQDFTGTPPPPGFTSDFTGSPPPGYKSHFTGGYDSGSTYGSSFMNSQRNANSGPGFWTGLGTGGFLGYLFGSQRSQQYHSPYYARRTDNYFSTPSYGGSSDYSSPSSSSGTRTASGFGGTKRR